MAVDCSKVGPILPIPMDSLSKEKKVDVLITEYNMVSAEIQTYTREMIRCFVYAAILVAVYLGWGNETGQGVESAIQKYLPYGFVVLVVYFLMLSYIKIGVDYHRARLETSINEIAGAPLLAFHTYTDRIHSYGFIRWGKKRGQLAPTPMLLFGILTGILLIVLFGFGGIDYHSRVVLIALSASAVIAIYVFILYPLLLRRRPR